MTKIDFEFYLSLAMSTGADFAEVFYEKHHQSMYQLIDKKIDSIKTNDTLGIGVRIIKGKESYYVSITSLDKDVIVTAIKKLIKHFNGKSSKKIILNNLNNKCMKVKIPHNKFSEEEKKAYLYKMDKLARSESPLISQVNGILLEVDRDFIIANSDGVYTKSNQIQTRIVSRVYAERDGRTESEGRNLGKSVGYEIIDEYPLEKYIKEIVSTAVEKLDAKDFKGGEYPVVLAPGFGAVIFHEACGHGLEATAVAPHLSVFSDDLGKKVASSKVTLIDDGTIPNAWGSFVVNDEAEKPEKNILIEDGILKKFLVDKSHEDEMKMKSNGCGRRQSYKFSPTSRMSNTYLSPGKDKIEDIIKSIDYGVYCESMSGGSVNTGTGDFNFSVETARLIEKGKLTKLVKGVALIGNSKDVLKNVEMVSDDLKIDAGYCGSKSGYIPVCIGQPTIKVSKILVGGKE